MKYELLIGRRYLRASRGNRFISFISTISMAGIAIGVAVLIVVLSVMNGFEREVRVRILSLTSHASISALSLRLGDWQDTAARVRDNPSVLAAAPFIEEQALLRKVSTVAGTFGVSRWESAAGKLGVTTTGKLKYHLGMRRPGAAFMNQ